MLERHGLGEEVFRKVNGHLEERGLEVSTGTNVDATILQAAASTKIASNSIPELFRGSLSESERHGRLDVV